VDYWLFRGHISSRHSLIQPQAKASKRSRLKAVTEVLLKILLGYDAMSIGKHLETFQNMHKCLPIDTTKLSRRHIFNKTQKSSGKNKHYVVQYKGKRSYPICYTGCAEKI
jgi:hypothetical protein